MSRLFFLLLYLIILCISNAVVVRMTDQKPKWAVTATKASTQESTPPPTPPQNINPSPNQDINPTIPDQNQQPEVNIDSIQKKRQPAPFSGPSALMPLQQICGSFNDGHYTYTACPYRSIVQTENQSNGYQGCIGIWGNYIESPDQQHEVRFLFTNGDTCPGDIERQTELIIACDESVMNTLKINTVNEREMCHYVIEASSSYICMLKPDDLASIVSEIKVTVSEAIPSNNEENEQQIEMNYDGVNDHMEYDDGYSEYGDYSEDLPPEYENEYVSEDGYSDELPSENVADDEIIVNGDSTENVSTENVSTENVSTENVSSDSVSTENPSTENPSTDNISSDNVATDNSPSPPYSHLPPHSHLPPNTGKHPRPHDYPRQPRRNKPHHSHSRSHDNYNRILEIKQEINALKQELRELEDMMKNYP